MNGDLIALTIIVVVMVALAAFVGWLSYHIGYSNGHIAGYNKGIQVLRSGPGPIIGKGK